MIYSNQFKYRSNCEKPKLLHIKPSVVTELIYDKVCFQITFAVRKKIKVSDEAQICMEKKVGNFAHVLDGIFLNYYFDRKNNYNQRLDGGGLKSGIS
jgi:hypothetical protein